MLGGADRNFAATRPGIAPWPKCTEGRIRKGDRALGERASSTLVGFIFQFPAMNGTRSAMRRPRGAAWAREDVATPVEKRGAANKGAAVKPFASEMNAMAERARARVEEEEDIAVVILTIGFF
jgi:hypothetical protein